MTNSSLRGSPSIPVRPPLPITIVRGMPVFDVMEIPAGEVVAMTQAYCVYRLQGARDLCVANWRDLAIGNICPADVLLPSDVSENDKRNAAATALRELLALKQVAALSPAQSTVIDQLTYLLCDS